MEHNEQHRPTRRDFLRASLAVSAPLVFVLGGGYALRSGTSSAAAESTSTTAAPFQAQVLPPTPECVDEDDDPTPSQTEGPFFTRSSPERTSLLEPGMGGTKILVSGYVLGTNCQPVPGALLDFWQADDRGVYDNVGYRLRGHQFADAAGRYSLETVVPGIYTGRTRHFHLKVQAPNGPVLTTQLYFPGEPANQRDGIFNPALLLDIQDAPDGSKLGRYDFVLNLS